MIENEALQKNEVESDEIDLVELFQFLKKNIFKIIIPTLICAIISCVLTIFVIDKKYESTTRLFLKPEVSEGVKSNTEISFNNSMVNNYVEILKGNNIQSQAANVLGVTQEEIASSLTIVNEANTQIIAISARTTDPELSKKFVDTVSEIFTEYATETLDINNITVVDNSEIPTSPVSPSIKKNLVLGIAVGLFLSVGYLFIRFMFDTRIHNKEEAEKYLGIPMLGSVPYFED